MKYMSLSFLTILLSIIMVSCSSKENEPTAFSADYYGEFISLTPKDIVAVETFNPQEVIDFIISNNVPYEIYNSVLIENVPKAERETNIYNVKINGDLAYICVKKELGEEGMITKFNITSYRFTSGTYKVITEDATPYERYIVVSLGSVRLEVWYDGKVTENVVTILELKENSTSYSIKDKCEEIEPYYTPLMYKSSRDYEEYGKAILNSDGNYTLKFDFSTYSLNPQTGNLIQLSPEYLEIGILDKK